MLPQSPTRFGEYRLISRIATGGMAEVYLGRAVGRGGELGPPVAIKRLLPHLRQESSIIRMFLNEARITAQVDHPNVVRVLAVGEMENEPFISMELLEGHSFAELRTRAAEHAQRVPVGVTLKILVDACKGLDAAHRAVDERGRFLAIVHRDFTPDNIHVGFAGDVKVIDFGIAKAENLHAGTEPGTLKGKFFYMSPEMIAGRSVDHRADVFAAGVMLYEQLCGRRPFTGLTPDEVLQRIAEGRPRPPRDFDPSVPPALDELCLVALAKEPEKRFTSLQQLATELEAVRATASAELVARYVSRVFPLEEDPKRQVLLRAKQAELGPVTPLPGPVPARDSTPPRKRWFNRNPAPLKMRDSRRVRWSVGALRAYWGHFRNATWRQRRPVLLALFVGLVAVGGATALMLRRPPPTAAERLAQAKATMDVEARASNLVALAADLRATPEQLAQAGALLLADGEAQEALTLAEALQARFPESADGPLIEAKACVELRLGKRAEAALERAQKLDLITIEPDRVLADLKERQGDLPAALEALGRAHRKRPSDVAVASRYGYLLSQTGKLDEAEKVLQGRLKSKFEPALAAELAFVKYRKGAPGEASGLLRKALQRDPQLAQAHYYLGAVLFMQGDIAGAEREYTEADRLAPRDSRALAALCEVQQKGGAADRAEKTRASIRARFPEDAPRLLASCVGQ
jgi:serine/threonine protein kinase/tetratricopeptide (TPR) repeat protein